MAIIRAPSRLPRRPAPTMSAIRPQQKLHEAARRRRPLGLLARDVGFAAEVKQAPGN